MMLKDRKITLKKGDFDCLETELKEASQFYKIDDCPIARAMKRKWFVSDVIVWKNEVTYIFLGIVLKRRINGEIEYVNRCRTQLLLGAKKAFIKSTKPYIESVGKKINRVIRIS